MAEREAGLRAMAANLRRARPLGADEGCDTTGFVAAGARRAPHPARGAKHHASAQSISGGTTRHPSYAVSQQRRKRVEEIFGWAKTVRAVSAMPAPGLRRVSWMFTFALAVYNLVRIRNLSMGGSRVSGQSRRRCSWA